MATIVTVNLELLEAKFKAFDWWWRMADDMRAYERGLREYRELVELARRFPPLEVGRLVKEYAPVMCATKFLKAVWPEVKA